MKATRFGFLAACFTLMMLLSLAGLASAHGMTATAKVIFQADQEGSLRVELLDSYLNPLPQGKVKAGISPEGAEPSAWVELKEQSSGLYVGAVSADLSEGFLRLQVWWASEYFVASIPLAGGFREGTIPLVEIDTVVPGSLSQERAVPLWAWAILAVTIAVVGYGVWSMYRKEAGM